MGAGKIIAIIGAILGILCIALYYVLPEIFCFWKFEASAILSSEFLGGFGSRFGETVGVEYGPEYAEDIVLLLIGILVVAGGALALIGGFFDSKGVTILGGLLMITGPVLLSIALFLELGDFEDIAAILPPGENLFFGSGNTMIGPAEWNVWISFFLAIGGGVLGIIGGAILKD